MGNYVLEIVEGPEAGRIIPLAGAVELGRDPAAERAVLQQDELSRAATCGSRPRRMAPGSRISTPATAPSSTATRSSARRISPSTASFSSASRCSSCGRPRRWRPARRASGRFPPSFTTLRPLPAAEPAATTIRQVAPGLAVEASEPDYVPANALERGGAASAAGLFPLLDTHTKGKARARRSGSSCSWRFAVILYFAPALAQVSGRRSRGLAPRRSR